MANSPRNQGFAKTERLRHRREFRSVERCGKRFFHRLFVLIWAPGATEWARLGITASRKVGNAVSRNRAKRLIREAFRRNKGSLPPATDLVIIARSALPTASYLEVERALLTWAGRQREKKGSECRDSSAG